MAITCRIHVLTSMSRRRERKKAGRAARIAKFISFALRIWFSSSIALHNSTITLDSSSTRKKWHSFFQNKSSCGRNYLTHVSRSSFSFWICKKQKDHKQKEHKIIWSMCNKRHLNKHGTSKLPTEKILKRMHHLLLISALRVLHYQECINQKCIRDQKIND